MENQIKKTPVSSKTVSRISNSGLWMLIISIIIAITVVINLKYLIDLAFHEKSKGLLVVIILVISSLAAKYLFKAGINIYLILSGDLNSNLQKFSTNLKGYFKITAIGGFILLFVQLYLMLVNHG